MNGIVPALEGTMIEENVNVLNIQIVIDYQMITIVNII